MAETAVRAAARTCDRCGRRGTRGFDGPRCADAAACGRRRERPAAAPPRGADRNRLPAWPVLAEVVRLARHRQLSLRELLGPELFGAYGNAQVAGTMSLVTLERFCDEVLGWHPRSLYGDAYDRAAHQPRVTARERAARRQAKVRPGAPGGPFQWNGQVGIPDGTTLPGKSRIDSAPEQSGNLRT